MKKRKTYEISVIDKTYSKIISDETKFYTSDTALELGFELKETEYTFESAEIVLLNVDDRSLVTRPVVKVLDSFAYELDDDITAHYGEWRGQLRFEQAGEVYVSSPVKFRIENDLSNDRPPQLSDVQSWVSLKRYADSLIEELKQAVLSVEGIEDTFNENETVRQTTFETAEHSRQTTFETNESERDETFSTNETTRQTQELNREKAEGARQQAESQRQTTFETNEAERQTTFETAEQERQSAELTRIENENQRNLTSVDEFIKLQNAIGGRNLIANTKLPSGYDGTYLNFGVMSSTFNVSSYKDTFTAQTTIIPKSEDYVVSFYAKASANVQTYCYFYNPSSTVQATSSTGQTSTRTNGEVAVSLTTEWQRYWVRWKQNPNDTTSKKTLIVGRNMIVPRGTVVSTAGVKLEQGTIPSDWSPAPEDYTTVSKEDYYNHIKLINDTKNNQFNQLRKAVIALGGSL